jgi:neurofibromin 1
MLLALNMLTCRQRIRLSQREADVRELVVTGLSHLVHANTEAGFKHCLPLAYDEDIRKRTIFARIFARVLKQGTKFEPPETSAMAKPSLLCQVRQSTVRVTRKLGLTCKSRITIDISLSKSRM